MSDLALLDYGAAMARQQWLMQQPEYDLCCDVAASCLRERPTEPAWRWAEQHVWLDEKMTAEPGYYDSSKTPWAREWQELPMRGDVREIAIKKSSRSGASEAGFNVVRWMPGHWPGNAGIVFPDDKQARDVARRRLLDSIKRSAAAQLSPDRDDTGLSNIHLLNMVIKTGPSGSARMFTEWWVRFFMLDELEEHSVEDTTTTYERALSRQTDVADAVLFAISKPKRAGGPIDRAYIRGTQKQWWVPCPRCERLVLLTRDGFRSEDCRTSDGSWDLDLVRRNTWYQCPHCAGRIDEKEKRAMNAAGVWVPTDLQHRRRNPDGKPVPPVPGVESYQITDYVSYHPAVTWGALRAMYLLAFEIQPTKKAQTHYVNNHEGEADEVTLIAVDDKTVEALKAGRIETRRVKMPDGSEIDQTEVLGIPGGYRLAYRQGTFSARLPYAPDALLMFADKQQSYFKYLVFAVRINPDLPGKVEAHLVDIGREDDEDALFQNVIQRDYAIEGQVEPARITGGFVDSRYRGQDVYKFCLRCYHELGVQVWPVRGEGEKESATRRKNEVPGDTTTRSSLRGRVFRVIQDWCESGQLMVRYFKDHDLKTSFYADKVQARKGWRIWLPIDYPAALAAEWTAEKYNPTDDEWVHNKAKYGPNDYGDCGKYLVLWMMENLNALLAIHGQEAEDEAASEAEEKPGRTYDLDAQPRRYDPPATEAAIDTGD
jgi:hypothetical protein